jgi:hypothetical protein
MRHKGFAYLVMGAGLAALPAIAPAAEPGEMGYAIARGSFDAPPLSANAGHGCEVIDNQIVLAEDVALGKLHGAARITIRYRPYPECKPWTLTTWIELKGEGSTTNEALGTLESQGELDFEMFAAETCRHNTRQMSDAGVWQARPLGGDKLRGEIFFPNVQGVNAVDFTLDVTWQTEVPEGFFGNEGTSGVDALFFFLNQLGSGL